MTFSETTLCTSASSHLQTLNSSRNTCCEFVSMSYTLEDCVCTCKSQVFSSFALWHLFPAFCNACILRERAQSVIDVFPPNLPQSPLTYTHTHTHTHTPQGPASDLHLQTICKKLRGRAAQLPANGGDLHHGRCQELVQTSPGKTH